jgi:hypothetical protein
LGHLQVGQVATEHLPLLFAVGRRFVKRPASRKARGAAVERKTSRTAMAMPKLAFNTHRFSALCVP